MACGGAKVHEKHVGQTPSSAPDPLVGLLGQFGMADEPTRGRLQTRGSALLESSQGAKKCKSSSHITFFAPLDSLASALNVFPAGTVKHDRNVNSSEFILNVTGGLEDGKSGRGGVFEQARAGDLEAFEALMRLHERQVLGTALRLLGRLEDAQDAAQEVFLRLFRNLAKLQTADAVAPWLYRVTVNACNDVWKKRRPESDIENFDFSTGAPDPELMAVDAERKRAVERGLERLGQKERAALVLREVEGLSTREVADVLGSSEVTVRTQISTARGKLREFTQQYLRKKA